MRVLIVYPRIDLYGGAELLVIRLANYLTRNNIENALLTTNICDEVKNDLAGTQIISYPYRPFQNFKASLNFFRLWGLLNKGLRKHIDDFDIINVHNYPADLAIYPFRKPVVWMCNEPPEVHVMFKKEKKYTLRWFVINAILRFDNYVVRRFVKNTVVADEFNQRRFKRIYGIDPHIINYGIDCHFFNPGTIKIEERNRERFTVLHVGMLTPLKNQMESIKTIEKLKDKIPGIKLKLAGAGEGQYLRQLNEYINAKQLKPYVEIMGHLSRIQLRDLYHTSQVLIHPIKPQGGWLSPFEAICAGLPIVASPEMTASNIITKNNLGIITDDFSTAILEIYQNLSGYERLADWRADWVRTHLSWDNFCEQMVNVFYASL